MANNHLCLRVMSKQLADDIGVAGQAQTLDKDKFINGIMAFYIQNQLRRGLNKHSFLKELVNDVSVDKSKILFNLKAFIVRMYRYVFDRNGKISLQRIRLKSSQHYNEFKSVDEIVTQV